MKVADLMQTDVTTVGPETTLGEAASTLADAHISGVPVVDGGGRIVGVLSITDILAAEEEVDGPAAHQSLFEDTSVRDVMSSQPITIAAGADVKEAAQQMLNGDVHRLFVTDSKRVVGIVSTSDIVRAVASGALCEGV